ncbi:hypothetical protein [Anaerolinea sp.]|uniref:hypothetical protein n=1 Tax=Anaerolinea sp. TaxID=1872519 RepID=UPI002ACDD181|nr:hypothetical protein [Anaerolinea sp.]
MVEEETCSAKNSESLVSDLVGSPEQVSIKNHFELSWSFLDDSVVNPKTRQKLRESGLPAWMFLSWYLYAVSQHSISNPVSFAVRKTLAERKGAGGKWDDLAKSPEILLKHESEMKTLFSSSTARITGNFLR